MSGPEKLDDIPIHTRSQIKTRLVENPDFPVVEIRGHGSTMWLPKAQFIEDKATGELTVIPIISLLGGYMLEEAQKTRHSRYKAVQELFGGREKELDGLSVADAVVGPHLTHAAASDAARLLDRTVQFWYRERGMKYPITHDL